MIELLLFVAAIAALYFGYTIGIKEGEERALSQQRDKVHAGMAPNSSFHMTYGVPGFYLSDTSQKLEGMPLITISSSNFLEFVARQKLSDEASREEIDAMKSQLADAYLMESGISADTLDSLKRAFPAR
jgi:hypothetical protein